MIELKLECLSEKLDRRFLFWAAFLAIERCCVPSGHVWIERIETNGLTA